MKSLHYIYRLCILLLGALCILPSCKSDDEEVNEWNSTFVYVQRTDYLVPNNSEWNLRHSEKGILGNTSLTFRLKTQKPVEKVVAASLRVKVSGDFTENIFTLSNDHPEIKPGEMVSEEITLSVSDFTPLEAIKDLLTFNVAVEIENVATENPNTFIASQSNLKCISIDVTKEAYAETPVQNLEEGEPANSSLMERSNWNIQVQPGTENSAENLIDGNSQTDVALDNGGFWVTVDFKSVKTVTGIRTQHWAEAYAPTKVEVFTSEDGSKWNSCGTLSVRGGTQNIKFIYPVETQYLKYQMLEVPSRVDITEFYVFEPQG